MKWFILGSLIVFALPVWGYTTGHAELKEGAPDTNAVPAYEQVFIGHVYHQDGSPAANATVEMYGTRSGTTTTDASGTFRFSTTITPENPSVCVSWKASIIDPTCGGHVRSDNGIWGLVCGTVPDNPYSAGSLKLGNCSNSGPNPTPGPSPNPTPPPSDDKDVKPIPYPSPIPTDSGFYGTAPDEAFIHTVSRSGGPIIRNVDIERVVGELKPEDGTLMYPEELVANGVISRYAILKIPAYDVDASAGELDHVLFNGVELGPEGSKAYLTGEDKKWFITEFRVPIELVYFGKRTVGQLPDAGHNEVKIMVDENTGSEAWRVAVGRPKIEFEALYPVVMVHGNGSCGAFFAGDWRCNDTPVAADRWFIRPFIDLRIPFDNSIKLDPDRIVKNAGALLSGVRSINKIAAEWGAKHVHIVAHSKGGLDVRGFLTGLASEDEAGQDLGVLSFTTLSTPHLGSVGADYQDTVRQLNDAKQLNKYSVAASDSPFNVLMAAALGSDRGKPDLRVDKMRQFNDWNISALPRTFVVDGKSNKVKYFAVAADANLDGSTADGSVLLKYSPEKFLPTISAGTSNNETEGIPYIPHIEGFTTIGKGRLLTKVYRLLGAVHEAILVDRPAPSVLIPKTIKAVGEIKEPCWFLLNDFAVTSASAIAATDTCDGILEDPLHNTSLPFEGMNFTAANHATLAKSETALVVIHWIRSTQPMPQ